MQISGSAVMIHKVAGSFFHLSMRQSDMRFWKATRLLLLALALLGLICTPAAASTSHVAHGPAAALAEDIDNPAMADMPCCPKLALQDGAICIFGPACMIQCFQTIWHQDVASPVSTIGPAPMIPRADGFRVG